MFAKKCDGLGSNAFGQCEQLKSVFINKKLTNTSGGLWSSEGPFCGCSSLNDVVFESGITGIPVSILQVVREFRISKYLTR